MPKEFLRQGQDFDLESILQNQSGQARIETSPGKYIIISAQSDTLNIVAENTSFFFKAEVRGGILSINTVLKESQGKRDQDLPSGKDLLRIAINFLEAHNTIKEFHALWHDNSDNFNQFLSNRNISGMSNEDAAWQTWSGQNIALRYGFTQIKGIYPALYGNDRFISVHFARSTHVTP